MNRIQFHTQNPNKRDILKVVEILKSGGTIVFPTDSLYAMGCLLDNKEGIEKIIKVTGKREKQAKLSLLCADLKSVADYTLPYSNHIFKTMKRYLPGPYTFILNADTKVTRYFKNNKREIGIRIPDNEIVAALLAELDGPLISTSLSLDDKVYTDPEVIEVDFKGKADVLLDGGLGTEDPSTVLDCTGDDIEIIRQGKGEID